MEKVVMYMLADFATFSLANMVATDNVRYPNLETMIPGIVCSLLGMGVGIIIYVVKQKIENKK